MSHLGSSLGPRTYSHCQCQPNLHKDKAPAHGLLWFPKELFALKAQLRVISIANDFTQTDAHQAHESNHQPLPFPRPSLAQPEKLLSGAARCHWQLGLWTIRRTINKCRAPGMATTEASRSPHQIANRNQRQNKEMADKGAASSSQAVFWRLEPLRQAATITLQ